MNITTDHKWRPFLYRNQIPIKVLVEWFDHLEPDDMDGYFRYRRRWYHISDFMNSKIEGWDGIHHDSFYSGVVIKISKDGEEYQVGTAIS